MEQQAYVHSDNAESDVIWCFTRRCLIIITAVWLLYNEKIMRSTSEAKTGSGGGWWCSNCIA